MPGNESALGIIRRHRSAFIAISVFLLLLELGIFAVAALRSGNHYRLQFIDKNGDMVYETDGKNLTDFNVYHFEKAHGPVEEYRRRLAKKDLPFPFRAWFVAAVGIPLGLILGFVFILRAYTAIFYGEEKRDSERSPSEGRYKTRMEKIIGGVQKFNIFIVGAAIFLAVIAYWILPNLVIYLGEAGVETLVRFKWVFLFVGLAVFAIMVWIIYLKFLLAKKTMDSQVEVDKYRMQLEYKHGAKSVPQLEHQKGENGNTPLINWDTDEVVDEQDGESS